MAGLWQHKWLQGLLDLLYPPHCVACRATGAWLCARCIEQIPLLDQPLGSLGAAAVPTGLEGVHSVAWHLPPIQQAVHALKYEGLAVLSATLGTILADQWQHGPERIDLLVPVPLHPVRLRRRGYNQAALLADALGQRIGLPVESEVLIRERDTRSQVGLSAEERWTNVAGAFRCRSTPPAGARILLVDDVLTTGATLRACAAALREAGAGPVWALTLTRAVNPAQDGPVGPV